MGITSWGKHPRGLTLGGWRQATILLLTSHLLRFCLSSSAHAGINQWTSHGPEGGSGHTLVIDPVTPTTLYVGTQGNGVFKSTDGGALWQASGANDLRGATITALAVDPATPAIVYAGTENGLFKSTDGRASWSPINNGLIDSFITTVAIDPVTPTTLYVGTDRSNSTTGPRGGFFKSTDGGANWTAQDDSLNNEIVQTLVFDPPNPLTLYAGTGYTFRVAIGGNCYKSTDGGATWTAPSTTPSSLAGHFVEKLAVDPQTSTTLYAQAFDAYEGGFFAAPTAA